MPKLCTKITNLCRSIMQLILRKGGIFRFRLFKINSNLPKRCNFYWFEISLTEGSEEETKFVEWVLGIEMLSSKPRPVLFKGDF